MNEKFAIALKQIALLGGINDYIAISSRELGEKLHISQQSASKRILELLEEGYIQRDLGARKQRIKITKKGLDALRAEYSEYQKIFELRDHLIIRGVVATGMGEGQYYVTQPGYLEQFKDKLGFIPFEGTLNLKMNPSDIGQAGHPAAERGGRHQRLPAQRPHLRRGEVLPRHHPEHRVRRHPARPGRTTPTS